MTIQSQVWGKLPDAKTVELFTLTNSHGLTVRATNYGGIIVNILAPDRDGKFADIVLGCDSLADYLKGTPYFGALCGRYANRIANGRFKLDARKYKLAQNNGKNSLHGGVIGFDKKCWSPKIIDTPQGHALELSYTSSDGEEGYPGNLHIQALYSLNDQNELTLDYFATAESDTVINLTNHSYFNLAGEGTGNVLGHEMTLHADCITPINRDLIPTGQFMNVHGTPFDFTKPQPIGKRINEDDEQLTCGLGYDHNWVINRTGPGLTLAARVREPRTGRVLETYTTQPGIQFYSGNFLNQETIGKGGKIYDFRFGFCLETQHFPDSPNHPHFPTTTLKPGQTYHQTTVYKFLAD